MFNLVDNTLQTSIKLTQVKFINEYGEFSKKYNLVNPLGYPAETMISFIIFIIFIFLTLFIGVYTFKKPNNDKDKDKDKPKETNQSINKIALVGFIISCFILLSSGTVSIYNYYKYYMQYLSWYSDLPPDAIITLGIISSLNSVINSKKNTNSANN